MPAQHFCIGGHFFAFEAPDSGPVPLRFTPGYQHFASAAPDSVAATYRLQPQEDYAFPGVDPAQAWWTSHRWTCGPAEDGRIAFRIRYAAEKWQTAALLSPDFSSGDIFPRFTADEEYLHFPFFHPIDLQVMINRFALLDAGLVHASGIRHEGQALLFCGRSGVGKSTTAKLWRQAGAGLMNDDRVLVQMKDGQAMAAATPWHGELPEIEPIMLPLSGIFHLKQGRKNQLRPLSYTESVTYLLATTVAPFYREEAMEHLTGVYAEALLRVPSYEFEFTPDASAVQAVLNILDELPTPT